MVSFTGSPDGGLANSRNDAARQKITLELGGNAGVIVHEDADVKSAVPKIALGAFSYAGQSCISVQRIVVQESIYEEFKRQFVDHVREHIKTGDPRDRETARRPDDRCERAGNASLAGLRTRARPVRQFSAAAT